VEEPQRPYLCMDLSFLHTLLTKGFKVTARLQMCQTLGCTQQSALAGLSLEIVGGPAALPACLPCPLTTLFASAAVPSPYQHLHIHMCAALPPNAAQPSSSPHATLCSSWRILGF